MIVHVISLTWKNERRNDNRTTKTVGDADGVLAIVVRTTTTSGNEYSNN